MTTDIVDGYFAHHYLGKFKGEEILVDAFFNGVGFTLDATYRTLSGTHPGNKNVLLSETFWAVDDFITRLYDLKIALSAAQIHCWRADNRAPVTSWRLACAANEVKRFHTGSQIERTSYTCISDKCWVYQYEQLARCTPVPISTPVADDCPF